MKRHLKVSYKDDLESSVYAVKGNKTSFCLTGSPFDSFGWVSYNEEYLRLTDTGNGLTVQFSDSKNPLELNYIQAEQLRLALKINEPDAQLAELVVRKFKVI